MVTLLCAGSVLLGLSVYLELSWLDVLDRHPILVNLLSGAIGFCFGLVVLSAVLASVLDNLQRRAANATVYSQLNQCTAQLQRMLESLNAGAYQGYGQGELQAATTNLMSQVWLYAESASPFEVSLHPQALQAASAWVGVWERLAAQGGVLIAFAAVGEVARCRASLNASTRTPSGAMAAKVLDDLSALAERFLASL